MKSPARAAALPKVLVFTLALLLGTPSQAAFVHPLDLPAVKSALASKGIFNGLGMAGQRVVAVGQRGHILYSDDAGSSWRQASVPVSTDLTAVFFASPALGWAVGHGGVVLATVDGGANWVKQLDGRALGKLMVDYYAAHTPALGPEALARLNADVQRIAEEGPDKPFLDVWFENERTGYVVGLFNLIFRTDDGGHTWVPWYDRTDNPKLLHFYAIRPVGDALYLAGEQGMVLKLDRSTQRFKALALDYAGTFFGITGARDAVLVYGLRGNAFRSVDGGKTWHKVETGVQVGLNGAAVASDGRIFLVSQAGQVLVSADAGKSFAPFKIERPTPGSAIVEVAHRALVVAGARGVVSQVLK